MNKYVLLVLLASCSICHANEMFALDYDEISAQGLTHGKEVFVLKGKTKRQGNEVFLDSFTFRVGEIDFEIPKKLMENLDSPYFALLRIVNDSGMVGNFYYISLPFGESEQCKPGDENSSSYREIFIHYKSNGEVKHSGIRDACLRE